MSNSARGVRGARGVKGRRGPCGKTGPVGVGKTGPMGLTGKRGMPGRKGIAGARGRIGSHGRPGALLGAEHDEILIAQRRIECIYEDLNEHTAQMAKIRTDLASLSAQLPALRKAIQRISALGSKATPVARKSQSLARAAR